MVRLVMVVPEFPKLSETFIVSKFLGLLERGWDVRVVCRRVAEENWALFPDLKAYPEIHQRVHATWPQDSTFQAAIYGPIAALTTLAASPGVTRRYLSLGRRKRGSRLLKDFYLDARLIELQPDIVHFEFGALAAERTYLKELLGCRLTASFRGYDLNYVGLDDPHYYEELWQTADKLHFLGHDLWQRAIRRGCPPDMDHALIPPAIDVTAFDPAALGLETRPERRPSDPLRIVSVGRLVWDKGYEYGLQAAERLKRDGIPFHWQHVGDGPYLESLAFARYEMSLEDSVEFLGPLPRPAVIEALSRADVFLHPAVREGFCNAALEAQAMQVPVVCSDADGLAENVADGRSGFVVGRRNPAALAEKLAFLAENPAVGRQMGQNGRERVVACFNLTDQAIAFDSFYRSVAGDHAN